MGESPFNKRYRYATVLHSFLLIASPNTLQFLLCTMFAYKLRCCILGLLSTILANMHRKLSQALCEVVEDMGLISFVPLAIQVCHCKQGN